MELGFDAELASRLLVAAAAGLVIGFEREYHGHAAGIRTMAMVALGACVFTMLGPLVVAGGDSTRIAGQVASGVGFLGAGAILRQRGDVKGLTTAAAVWVTAALGTAAGFGKPLLVGTGVVVVLLVLAGIQPIEKRLFERRQPSPLRSSAAPRAE